jgi:hypothetical protein
MREGFAFRQIGMLPTWIKNRDGEEKTGRMQKFIGHLIVLVACKNDI